MPPPLPFRPVAYTGISYRSFYTGTLLVRTDVLPMLTRHFVRYLWRVGRGPADPAVARHWPSLWAVTGRHCTGVDTRLTRA